MAEAAGQLRTVEITYAVRDSDAFEGGIKAGDILAIVDGEIKRRGSEPRTRRRFEAVEQMMSDDDEAPLISMYYGADVDEAEARRRPERCRQRWPASEVEVYEAASPFTATFCPLNDGIEGAMAMAGVKVVTDSGADIPKTLARSWTLLSCR